MGHLYSIINSVCTVRGQIPANVPSIISHGNWYLSWISCESAKALLEQQDPLQKKRTTLRPNKFKFGITDCRRAWFVKTAQLLLSFWTSLMCLSSVQFSHSVMSDSLRCHGLQQTRPPCPSPTPRVYPNSCPLSWWCHPTISSSVIPFSSHLQSKCGRLEKGMANHFSILAWEAHEQHEKGYTSWGCKNSQAGLRD